MYAQSADNVVFCSDCVRADVQREEGIVLLPVRLVLMPNGAENMLYCKAALLRPLAGTSADTPYSYVNAPVRDM